MRRARRRDRADRPGGRATERGILLQQSGITDTSRGADWDQRYLGYLEAMAAVPGIGSSQRFAALDDGPPPSLAMYSISAPAVSDSEIYPQTRGTGPWKPLID
jgi:hypothetical protein